MALSIKEVSFEINHLHINTSRIDKFINLADNEFNDACNRYSKGLELGSYEPRAVFEACKAAEVQFSIYSLGIIHCYSLLENNRTEIMSCVFKSTPQEKEGFHKIKLVTEKLNQKIKNKHKSIAQYSVAEEFREVANAIKHSAFHFSTEVTTKKGVKYKVDDLRELYAKNNLLNDYLKNLYSKITS